MAYPRIQEPVGIAQETDRLPRVPRLQRRGPLEDLRVGSRLALEA